VQGRAPQPIRRSTFERKPAFSLLLNACGHISLPRAPIHQAPARAGSRSACSSSRKRARCPTSLESRRPSASVLASIHRPEKRDNGAAVVGAGLVIVSAIGLASSIRPQCWPGYQQHRPHVRTATSSNPAPIAARISRQMVPPPPSIPIAMLITHIDSEPSRKPSCNPSHSASPYGGYSALSVVGPY
jgi:hypothetical protein